MQQRIFSCLFELRNSRFIIHPLVLIIIQKMTEVLYYDSQVTVYKDLIVINKYYFPLATSKTILFSDIETVSLIDSEGVNHKWGVSTKYLNNWFPYDTDRKKKTKFVEFRLKGRKMRPSITADDPDKVFKIIWEYHTPEGKKYAEEESKKSEKETEVAQQELIEHQKIVE